MPGIHKPAAGPSQVNCRAACEAIARRRSVLNGAAIAALPAAAA